MKIPAAMTCLHLPAVSIQSRAVFASQGHTSPLHIHTKQNLVSQKHYEVFLGRILGGLCVGLGTSCGQAPQCGLSLQTTAKGHL